MSLQQQLQLQFQRQLHLNLQGGGEAAGGPLLPDPPDTILDIDPSSPSISGENSQNTSSNNIAPRSGSGVNSAGLLETLLRSAQAASAQQRVGHSRDSGTGSSGSSLMSRSQGHNPHSNSHHGQYHRHPHTHSHGFHIVGDGNGEGSSTTEISNPQSHSDTSGDIGTAAVAPGPSPPPNDSNTGGPGVQPPAELSLLYKWVLESGVFVFLLLLHFLYDHRFGK